MGNSNPKQAFLEYSPEELKNIKRFLEEASSDKYSIKRAYVN